MGEANGTSAADVRSASLGERQPVKVRRLSAAACRQLHHPARLRPSSVRLTHKSRHEVDRLRRLPAALAPEFGQDDVERPVSALEQQPHRQVDAAARCRTMQVQAGTHSGQSDRRCVRLKLGGCTGTGSIYPQRGNGVAWRVQCKRRNNSSTTKIAISTSLNLHLSLSFRVNRLISNCFKIRRLWICSKLRQSVPWAIFAGV